MPPERDSSASRDSASSDPTDVDVVVDVRDESPTERADRNWIEVLQELRVMQTGTQILTGFLLALAFQPAFAGLSAGQRTTYLALIVLSALTSIVALAPVALHRILFHHGAKPEVVAYGHAALLTSMFTVSILLVGVVGFVFDVVVDGRAATIAVIALTFVVVSLWVAAPTVIRKKLAPRRQA